MDSESSSSSSFITLLSLVRSLLKTYQKDCEDKSSWIHWYVQRINMKVVHVHYDETRESFIKKVEMIYDMMVMTHHVVKVVNKPAFSQKGLDTLVTERKKALIGLHSLSDEEWSLFRDQLRGSQYGLN